MAESDPSGAPPTSSCPWLRNYSPGVAHTLELPETSLVHVLEAAVREAGARTALEFFGARTTYASLGEQVERVAEALRAMGVRAGDRVALVLPNCPQHVVAFYAVLRVGGVVVEHNPLYTAEELRHQFEDHGAKAAIVWDRAAGSITGLPDAVRPRQVVAVSLLAAMPLRMRLALRLPVPSARAARDRLQGPAPGTIPGAPLLAHPRIDAHHPRPGAHDLALLLYTSGTTGRPKGAMLTHRNLESNAEMGREWVQPGAEETIYAVLPLFHAYGMTLGMGIATAIRARLVLFPTVDVDLIAKALRRSRPTILPAVPPVYRRLLEADDRHGLDLRGIRYAVSGAMNLPPDLVAAWEERSGGFLVEGYGLTECAPLVACNPLNSSRRAGSIGVPFPSTEIRIVDPEAGEDVAAGEAGELWVRGPQTFRGYWRDEEATRAAFSADGWLRTGDIVRMDGDGFLSVVDRLKELIITGGFNVSPSEVEEALRADDAVADAAVVGLPAEGGGEEVVAAVITAPGAAFDAEALRARCYQRVTRYKVPRRIVELEDFPRSMLGKTLRREVRELLREREG